ncbi:hypothetical protein Kisp01_50130 [Kineosporia sp. NBRC 101677]|uniref:DUF4913 domain-containing protein n=1 Tax=Kineosporia sp. NBRC 101677 TaxID=3032197 RepID=UPI0024A16F9F|nr:DUF4913 domain-containing protein [Kineosporia sp. NBRC 101677]GLY17999.1 hypothetical protein Kisp01_50130 [Kineosporia sp. NBRC 101677]
MEDHEQIQALTLAVEELRAAREEDRVLIEQLQISALVSRAGEAAISTADTVYPGWTIWVDEWLTVRISRRQQRIRWCLRYAEHPEPADRLEALWRSWEAQWPDPEMRLAWFRDGFDHHFAVITAEDGPLRDCSAFEGVHSLPPSIQEKSS